MLAPLMADVNWLLSALAQASAALIAIVGGLLVSRYVTLHAEQEAARRRVADLTRRVAEAGTDLTNARWALDSYHVDDALDDDRVFEAIVQANLEPTIPTILEALDRDGHDLNEAVLHEELSSLTEEIGSAIRVLGDLVPVKEKQAAWDEFRRLHRPNVRHRNAWEWVYDELCRERREEAVRRARERAKKEAGPLAFASLAALSARSDPILSTNFIPPQVSATNRMIRGQRELARVASLEGDIARAEAELRALGQERRLADETFEATRQPEGFGLALRVLTVLALLGMGLPVVLMGFGPLELPVWVRATVIASFFAGVTLLLRFLFVYASYLNADGRPSLPKGLLGLLVPSKRAGR